VATSVLTAGLLYIPIFTIHLVLTASVLSTVSLVRAEAPLRHGPTTVRSRAGFYVPGDGTAEQQGVWGGIRSSMEGLGLHRWLTVLVVVIGAFTIALFPLIPRLSTQRLFDQFSQSPPSGAVSDFGEDIEFGQYQQISLSNEVALYAAPRNPAERGDHVRLRGVTVDTFDGTRWRRTTQLAALLGGVTYSTIRYNPTAKESHWTILLQPGKASHLFAPSFPAELRVDNNQTVLFDQASASAQLPGVPNKLFSYRVVSRLDLVENRRDPGTTLDTMFLSALPPSGQRNVVWDDPRPAHLRPDGGTSSAAANETLFPSTGGEPDGTAATVARRRRNPIADESYRNVCLQVPDLLNTSQLLQLAREWTEGTGDNPYRMAVAIEARLKNTFQYSLVQSSRGNFIEDFLLRTRSGHCEYFATSMAILLRLLGVPTRVANGYYSTEWDEVNSTYIVRQKDAHAWVEVYLGDEHGWMTFDPTPAAGVSRSVAENPISRRWREFMDSLRLRWYRNVIDFSIQDQTAVRRALFSQSGIMARVYGLFGQATTQRWDRGIVEAIPATAIGIGLIGVGALALAIALREQILRLVLRIRLWYRGRPTTVAFYAEILMLLKRRGLNRPPEMTPREFAQWIRTNYPELDDLPAVTETYYAVRYSDHIPTAEENDRTARLLKLLRSWKPRDQAKPNAEPGLQQS
jgi:transglutaminase-like putative cysteine protease